MQMAAIAISYRMTPPAVFTAKVFLGFREIRTAHTVVVVSHDAAIRDCNGYGWARMFASVQQSQRQHVASMIRKGWKAELVMA